MALPNIVLPKQDEYTRVNTITDVYWIRKHFKDYMNIYRRLGCLKRVSDGGRLMIVRSINGANGF